MQHATQYALSFDRVSGITPTKDQIARLEMKKRYLHLSFINVCYFKAGSDDTGRNILGGPPQNEIFCLKLEIKAGL